MSKQQVHEIKRGMLVARVSFGHRKGRMRHRLDLFRLFRNGDQWQKSRRFCPEDIPVMRLLLDEAYGWVLLEQEKSNKRTDDTMDTGGHVEHL